MSDTGKIEAIVEELENICQPQNDYVLELLASIKNLLPHPEHAEGSSLGERDCDKCLRLCPQQWEILKTGSTKEEWGHKQAEWWNGRSKHMGCGNCNIEQMYTHPMTGEGEGR